MPKRIQRKRTKGWRMPENAVSVTRPGRWGNPYKVDEWRCDDAHSCPYRLTTEAAVLDAFRRYVKRRSSRDPDWLAPLRGKDLACWCPEDAEHCHADVLLELANREES